LSPYLGHIALAAQQRSPHSSTTVTPHCHGAASTSLTLSPTMLDSYGMRPCVFSLHLVCTSQVFLGGCGGWGHSAGLCELCRPYPPHD
jgi:hypothetical protein